MCEHTPRARAYFEPADMWCSTVVVSVNRVPSSTSCGHTGATESIAGCVSTARRSGVAVQKTFNCQIRTLSVLIAQVAHLSP
jgi:hypothetical protein